MGKKAREYKRSTIRRLDTLSGNQCAMPTCNKPLIAEDGISIVSKICHIEAASDNGPRYNPDMTDDDRRHYNNLILLCDEHHVIIDNKENEDSYPKELLIQWKNDHEGKMIYKLQKSSALKEAIFAISDMDEFDHELSGDTSGAFVIKSKIDYNSIRRNRFLIEEYKVFHSKINTIYTELENNGSFKKEKLLRNIQLVYLKAKGKILGLKEGLKEGLELDLIREHADDIFEEVEEQLLTNLGQDDESSYIDDISFAITVVMVDAFMRCKIFEEPSKTDVLR